MTKPDDRLEALVQEVYPHLMLADLSENQEMAILTDFAKQIQQQADTVACPEPDCVRGEIHEGFALHEGDHYDRDQHYKSCQRCSGTGRIAKPLEVPCPAERCVQRLSPVVDADRCRFCHNSGTVTLAERDRWQWEQAADYIYRAPKDGSWAAMIRAEAERRFPKQSKEE